MRLCPSTGRITVLCYSTRTGSGCRTARFRGCLSRSNVDCGRFATSSSGSVNSIMRDTARCTSIVCVPASGAVTRGARTVGGVTLPTKAPVVTKRRNVYGKYKITALSVDCCSVKGGTNRVTCSVLMGNTSVAAVGVRATPGMAGRCGGSVYSRLNIGVPSSCGTVRTRWLEKVNVILVSTCFTSLDPLTLFHTLPNSVTRNLV